MRFQHHDALLDVSAPVGWLEIHAENYFGGGRSRHCLERLAETYPISVHGVGLSLGAAEPVDRAHLARLKSLIDWLRPGLVSEHVAWSGIGGVYLNDLLPLPYTEEALALMVARVGQLQDTLGRRVLVENVSSYVRFTHSTLAEWEFLAALAARSGCGLLLDVNNVYVNSLNFGFDADAYIAAMPSERIAYLHVAGHYDQADDLKIDTHGAAVIDPVWALLRATYARHGVRPTLLERDFNFPPLAELYAELAHIRALQQAATPLSRYGT